MINMKNSMENSVKLIQILTVPSRATRPMLFVKTPLIAADLEKFIGELKEGMISSIWAIPARIIPTAPISVIEALMPCSLLERPNTIFASSSGVRTPQAIAPAAIPALGKPIYKYRQVIRSNSRNAYDLILMKVVRMNWGRNLRPVYRIS